MKSALKYSAYWLVVPPINAQKAFPGNIGDGIRRDADVNITKKIISMDVPLIIEQTP